MNAKQENFAKDFISGLGLNTHMTEEFGEYVVTESDIKELAGGKVMLSRTYHNIKYTSVTYDECIVVGKRLGVEKIYNHVW